MTPSSAIIHVHSVSLGKLGGGLRSASEIHTLGGGWRGSRVLVADGGSWRLPFGSAGAVGLRQDPGVRNTSLEMPTPPGLCETTSDYCSGPAPSATFPVPGVFAENGPSPFDCRAGVMCEKHRIQKHRGGGGASKSVRCGLSPWPAPAARGDLWSALRRGAWRVGAAVVGAASRALAGHAAAAAWLNSGCPSHPPR